MKKFFSLILALVMICALAACGDSKETKTTDAAPAANNSSAATEANQEATEAPAEETTGVAAGEAHTFTYGSTKIAMNADTAPIVDALGEPKSYTEEESCAFEGLSKTYYFGSFYLETYPDGDTDRVYCVWLVDDSVATEEGVYIGATQAQVEKAYGAEWFNGKNAYIVKTGDCILTIILENGVVNSIQYTAVTQ